MLPNVRDWIEWTYWDGVSGCGHVRKVEADLGLVYVGVTGVMMPSTCRKCRWRTGAGPWTELEPAKALSCAICGTLAVEDVLHWQGRAYLCSDDCRRKQRELQRKEEHARQMAKRREERAKRRAGQ